MSPYAKFMYTHECPRQIRTLERNEHKVKFLSDGRLYIQHETHVEIFTKGFCLENFYDPESGKVYMSAFKCATENVTLNLSLPQTSRSNVTNNCNFESLHRWLRFAFTFCGFFSLPFLILTLFFYITLPELGNFQGNIICAYIISTLLTTICLIVIYNVSSDGDENGTEFFIVVSETGCQTMGYLLYCSGLLMFTWMSVLCFDLLR
jgi:hypothetical protein